MVKALVRGTLLVALAMEAGAQNVSTVPAPSEGFRPQAVLDAEGVLHVVQGVRGHWGDCVYVRRPAGATAFSAPILVTETQGIAAGFDMAVGAGGRVHVLMRTTPKYSKLMDPDDEKVGFFDLKYMLYARLNDAGDAFEPARNLAGDTIGFEGPGAILADGAGRVLAFWHGQLVPKFNEPSRAVFRALSTDGGRTFGAPEEVRTSVVGACQCCGVAGALGAKDEVLLAYRGSIMNDDRTHTKDSYVLASSDLGRTFEGTLLEPWEMAGCPGSLGALAHGPGGAFVAWRTRSTVHFAKVGATDRPLLSTRAGNARMPAIVCNSKGQVLFVWAVTGAPGTKGAGDVAWQVFDVEGNPISLRGTLKNGVASGWGAPAAYAEPDGDFVILYDGEGE